MKCLEQESNGLFVRFAGQIMAGEIYSVLVVTFWKVTGLDERVQAWTLYHLKNSDETQGV